MPTEHRKYRKDPRFDGKLWFGDFPYDIPDDAQMFIDHEVIIIGAKDSNNAIQFVKCDTEGRLDVVGVCPEHQADAYLNQTTVVSGAKEVVLDTTEYVRLISAAWRCTWTVQPTPIEFYVTADGNTLQWNKTDPVSNTWYFAQGRANVDSTSMAAGTADYSREMPFVLEARSLKAEVEITGGTVSALQCRVKYAKW